MSELSPQLKMQIILQSLKKDISDEELAKKYAIDISELAELKEQFLKNAHIAFAPINQEEIKNLKEQNTKLEKLVKKINTKTNEDAKKLHSLDNSIKKQLIDANARISVTRQCEIIDLNRQTLYYKARASESKDLVLMQKIIELYNHTIMPNKGYRAIHQRLSELGYKVGVNKVNKLMNTLSKQNLLTQIKKTQS